MTATPLRADNKDTYRYFGNPIYQYSLRTGIDDGFLAPYRVHRVVTTVDDLTVPVIGREELLRNKEATGRPQDLADAAWLRSRGKQ